MHAPLRIRMLGPVTATGPEGEIDLGARRHREVLAALAVDAGRVVPVDTLLDRVWGADSPPSPTSLHAIVSRLRGRLREATDVPVIVTQQPGYRLDVSACSLDTLDLVAGVRQARDLLAAGDAAAAREVTESALALWRGRPYSDVRAEFAEAEADRLEQEHLAAEELLVRIDQTLGDTEAILQRVPRLLDAHPLREPLRAALMLALYRAGRQAEALAAYDAGRQLLADELGLDPSPELRELHGRILRQDPDLRGARRRDAPAEATPAGAGSSFADLLRELRAAAGLSQEELAARAHLTTHAVSALERGTRTRPYPQTVRALAEALDASEEQRSALVAAVPRRGSTKASPSSPAAATLPVPATALVGRDEQVGSVADLLRDPDRRLVTLTGTGGVGKTRVAIAVAEQVAEGFPDGAAYVPLASLSDPTLVLPAIADSLGSAGAGSALDTLTAFLSERRTLLVLDNVEHLLRAAPDVATLIERCPGLTVLATSRAVLAVRGETEVPVPPLALPAGTHPAADDVAGSPAGALFLQRARSVSPGFELTQPSAAAVARICRRLAGIPLAIELAAAQVRFLEPATLLGRLDEAIAGGGARDLPERQRTMRATLDWSYRLLEEEERVLLRMISVFSDGFTLVDAEGVAAGAGTLDAARVLPLLGRLVEHSLVTPAPGATTGLRYRVLEPVSQYARARLEEAGEAAATDAAHTRHYRELAERAYPEYQREQQIDWLARIDAEHANLTVALERSLTEKPDDAARIGWSLWLYWWLRGHLKHGRQLLEETLAHPLPEDLRARVEIAAATMAFAQDDVPASGDYWGAATERARLTGDRLSQANALAGLGLVALAGDDLPRAKELLDASLEPAAEVGEEAEWIRGLTEIWLGTVALLGGDLDLAERRIGRGLDSARKRGDRLSIYIGLYNLTQVAMLRGDLGLARRHIEEGLNLTRETRDLANLGYLLDAAAVVEAADRRHDRVPVLLGAAQGIREELGTRGYGYYRPDEQQLLAAAASARGLLGDDAYDDAVDAGRAMTADQAARYGLGGT